MSDLRTTPVGANGYRAGSKCPACGGYISQAPHARAKMCRCDGVIGRLLSEVEPEEVRWLWPGRVPLGKLTVLDGDPGLGKSALTVDMAARVTAGRRWPDGAPCESGGVVLLNAEDGPADTIRPRLDAAGGDASRVLDLTTVPDGDGERLVSIPEDLDKLQSAIDRVGARLVVTDPFMAFLGGWVNAHKDQDVRRALAPLARLADATGAAVVIVRHLNKSVGGNSLYRGGGSVGIVGAARSGLIVAKHPENDELRVIASLKSNLSRPAPSLVFGLEEAPSGAVRVAYKGESTHSADTLLSAPTDPEERSALDEATEFLQDALGRGPMHSKSVKKEAYDADIRERTLKRAKAALGVRSVKEGDGSWSWHLPGAEKRQGTHTADDGPVGPLGPVPIDTGVSVGQGGQPGQEGQASGDGPLDSDWRQHPLDCECDPCTFGPGVSA